MRELKKLDSASGDASEESVDLETILVAATSRGLTLTDSRRMTLGQVVDYCIEWQNVHHPPEAGQTSRKQKATRKATQSDWDSFLG